MTSRTRLLVLLVSTPIIALAMVGGFLSRAMAGEESYQHLRVFEDVVSLIMSNYVEPVDTDAVMEGAMRGLAEGLDADSAYLTPTEVSVHDKELPSGTIGVELTRQYYLRVISAMDGSPAARAGLMTGDYIRAIDGKSTREMSVYTGMRMLRGEPGTSVKLTVIRGNAAEPHEITVQREKLEAPPLQDRMVRPDIALIRIPAFTEKTADALERRVKELQKAGASHLILDLRGTASGAPELGLTSARLFVGTGTLASRDGRAVSKVTFSARSGDGSLTIPLTLLVDNGTSRAAEVFAGAITGNGRGDLVGERTLGRAGEQELVPLPDGSALWMTTAQWLLPDGTPIHGKPIVPTVEVESPDVEFGATATADPILDKAIERITSGEKLAA